MAKLKAVDISPKPTRAEAESAVETLLRYIGEDPSRPGLIETPDRFVRAYDEFFEGYRLDPVKELSKTFEDIEDYNDMVIVRGIDFISHCEHHLVQISGSASVAYWPDQKVVGISKLARVVDIFAKRLISQENMTTQIASVIEKVLKPKGTAVLINADHHCMSTRGVEKSGSSTVTTDFRGVFEASEDLRNRFLRLSK